MKYIVNGKAIDLSMSYEDVVRRAGRDPERVYTVTWHDGRRGGTLTHGESVDLVDGMAFNVSDTSGA